MTRIRSLVSQCLKITIVLGSVALAAKGPSNECPTAQFVHYGIPSTPKTTAETNLICDKSAKYPGNCCNKAAQIFIAKKMIAEKEDSTNYYVAHTFMHRFILGFVDQFLGLAKQIVDMPVEKKEVPPPVEEEPPKTEEPPKDQPQDEPKEEPKEEPKVEEAPKTEDSAEETKPTEEPKPEEPKQEEAAAEPTQEEAKTEEPPKEEAKPEEAPTEPPKEEAKTDEPAAEEPKPEEQKSETEEPPKEEPKTDEAPQDEPAKEQAEPPKENDEPPKEEVQPPEETKEEAPKTDEEPKEEPKPEETPAEETKTEEPKAEEPQPEEPKGDEPKAEEPKPEEETPKEEPKDEPKAEEPQPNPEGEGTEPQPEGEAAGRRLALAKSNSAQGVKKNPVLPVKKAPRVIPKYAFTLRATPACQAAAQQLLDWKGTDNLKISKLYNQIFANSQFQKSAQDNVYCFLCNPSSKAHFVSPVPGRAGVIKYSKNFCGKLVDTSLALWVQLQDSYNPLMKALLRMLACIKPTIPETEKPATSGEAQKLFEALNSANVEDDEWTANVPEPLKGILENPLGVVPEETFRPCVGKKPTDPDFLKSCKPFCERYSLVKKSPLVSGNVCSQTQTYRLVRDYQWALANASTNQFKDDMNKLMDIIGGAKHDLPCEPVLVNPAKGLKGLETYTSLLNDGNDGYDPLVYPFKKAAKRSLGQIRRMLERSEVI